MRTGRCTNDLFCVMASRGHVLAVPADARFVCEHCGKPLLDAAMPAAGRAAIAKWALGGGLVVAGAAAMAGGAFWTKSAPPSHLVASAALTRAAAALPPAIVPPPQPEAAKPAPAASPMPAKIDEAANIAPQPPVLVHAAFIQPGPAPLAATPIPLGQATQVQVALLQQRIPQARVTVTPPVPDAKQQAQAKAEAAAQAEARLALQQEAMERQDLLVQQQMAARAQQQAAAAAQAKPAPVVAAAPVRTAAAVPAGPTRLFSPRALSGGHPAFPGGAFMDERAGRVQVRCVIDTTGSPTNCGVERSDGGPDFGKSVMNWLGSGQVRFAPILRNGTPVAETHSWQIDFQLK